MLEYLADSSGDAELVTREHPLGDSCFEIVVSRIGEGLMLEVCNLVKYLT